MSIKKTKTFVLADPVLSRVQTNLQQSIDQYANIAILNGVLLKSQSLTSGKVNQIDHGLGRAPLGWFPVRIRASSYLWDSQDTENLPEQFLDLHCSSNVVVDLWVF